MARGFKTGGGPRTGSPNKATADVRKCMALIAERNVMKLEGWLTRVAKDDPGRAADIFLRAIEYHIPRLQRSEFGAGQGEKGTQIVRIEFLSVPDKHDE